MKKGQLTEETIKKIYKMTKLYGRIVKQEENGSEDTKETDK